jgi:hypothetical protein
MFDTLEDMLYPCIHSNTLSQIMSTVAPSFKATRQPTASGTIPTASPTSIALFEASQVRALFFDRISYRYELHSIYTFLCE